MSRNNLHTHLYAVEWVPVGTQGSDVNKDLGPKAKVKAKDLVPEAMNPHQA